MNHPRLRRPNVLPMHSDPTLCAGFVAELGADGTLDVFDRGDDKLISDGLCISAVIADDDTAVRLADPSTRSDPAAATRKPAVELTLNHA